MDDAYAHAMQVKNASLTRGCYIGVLAVVDDELQEGLVGATTIGS